MKDLRPSKILLTVMVPWTKLEEKQWKMQEQKKKNALPDEII